MKNLFSKSLMLCLCVLLVIGSVSEWGMIVRVGLIIVAVAMLVDVIITAGGMINGKRNKKKD